jgi:hypothetical protein
LVSRLLVQLRLLLLIILSLQAAAAAELITVRVVVLAVCVLVLLLLAAVELCKLRSCQVLAQFTQSPLGLVGHQQQMVLLVLLLERV